MVLSVGFVLLAVGCFVIAAYVVKAQRSGEHIARRRVVLESLCVVVSSLSFLFALAFTLLMPMASVLDERLHSSASATARAAVPLMVSVDRNAALLLAIALIVSAVPLVTLRWKRRYAVELASGALLSVFVLLSMTTVGMAFVPAALFMVAAGISGVASRQV